MCFCIWDAGPKPWIAWCNCVTVRRPRSSGWHHGGRELGCRPSFSPARLVVRLSLSSMGKRCFSQIARDLPAKWMGWITPSWLCLKFKPPAHTSSWPLLAPRSWADQEAPRTAWSFLQLRVCMVMFMNTATRRCPGCSLQQVLQEENDLLFSLASPSSYNCLPSVSLLHLVGSVSPHPPLAQIRFPLPEVFSRFRFCSQDRNTE